MGYSRSPDTLIRRLALIEPLAEGGSVTWQTTPGEEHRVAYKIREALRVARQYKEDFPHLAPLGERYRISIQGPGLIVAQEINPEPEVRVVVPADGRTTAILPLPDGATTSTQIVQFLIDSAPESARKINFPNAKLPPDELRKLYAWTNTTGWLVFVSEQGITLLQYDAELRDVAFNPETDL